MGLDISYSVDNDEKIFDFDYITDEDLQKNHSLSRTFCKFYEQKKCTY